MSHDALAQALARRMGELPQSLLEALPQARLLNVARSQTLLRAGDRWSHLWWVEHGALRLYYLDRDGAAANKNFFLDDALFWPVTPPLRERPVGFFVEALEDSQVWALPYTPLALALDGHAAWTRLQQNTLCALLDDKMQREQAFLQSDARARYEALLRDHPAWAGRIALKHLASYLGMTAVSLSRLRARMGLIPG